MNTDNKERCCEKCQIPQGIIDAGHCFNPKCPCHTDTYHFDGVAHVGGAEVGEKKCTAMTEHDHWCDCGQPICWEEQLRLRVNFDTNADREVCILFIHRMCQRAYEEGVKEGEHKAYRAVLGYEDKGFGSAFDKPSE